MKKRIALTALGLAATSFVAWNMFRATVDADRIFYGDNIITMDPSQPSAEAVAILDDKIVFVGKLDEAKQLAGISTEMIDLGTKTLLPGLIDAHGHMMGVAAMAGFVNASSPPVGNMQSIDDIVALLKAELAARKPAEGEWLIAYGYDDSLLKENRHPTRDDLDKVSKDIPIYMIHVSGHLGAANSAALDAVSYTAATPNPEGGVIRRYADSNEPNGVVEEKAATTMMMTQLANPKILQFARNVLKAEKIYASYGVTTIQDGGSVLKVVKFFRLLGSLGLLTSDIGAYMGALKPEGHSHGEPEIKDDHVDLIAAYEKDYRGSVRVAGVKFLLDGSPQGRTAWVTKPYNEGPEGAGADYVAYPTVEPQEFKAEAKKLLLAGVPILAHANGDAAIDLMLDGVEEAFAGKAIPDHRSVIIHAQLMRQDQLDRAKKLNVIPSFYSAHPFFWGDWHRKSFGDERALNISPAASALAKGVPFTIHNDSPVVPPDMMRLLWVAVNRETRSGFILGEGERISPMEGLKAMTSTAAYQYFEEDKKGSLTEGKQADLVILDSNPIAVDPKTIKDIKVLETIAHGKTIFKR